MCHLVLVFVSVFVSACKDNLHGNQARGVKTVPREDGFHRGSERKPFAQLLVEVHTNSLVFLFILAL